MTPDQFSAKWMPEPNSGCWLWMMAHFPQGYGAAHAWIDGTFRQTKAHRLSWLVHRGPIPAGIHAAPTSL